MATFKLKMLINVDQLEEDLKSDFASKIVKRKNSSSLILRDDTDITVVFRVKENTIMIYSQIRFLTRMFAMNLCLKIAMILSDLRRRQVV